jgi:hypothetical protein
VSAVTVEYWTLSYLCFQRIEFASRFLHPLGVPVADTKDVKVAMALHVTNGHCDLCGVAVPIVAISTAAHAVVAEWAA